MKLLPAIIIFAFFCLLGFSSKIHKKHEVKKFSNRTNNTNKLIRNKRDTDCIDVQSCCYVQFSEEADIFSNECMVEMLMGKTKCFMACIIEKFEFYPPAGEIVLTKLKNYMYHKINVQYWWVPEERQAKIIEKCFNPTKLYSYLTKESDVLGCRNLLTPIGHCIFVEAQLHCPSDYIRDHNSCAQFLSYMSTHKQLPSLNRWCKD